MSNKVFDFINLHNGEEEQKKVLENIKSNISFRGSNLWILACAIVIASVGLNVNSTAVIIGAMLISPLMSPIVGAGFALAIYDFELLKKSGKNLLIATIVSLVVASIYFFISPFKETQSELLARTSPNIYDVLIAFFGGLVGVIALTRVEKGNPIPGVAIATALMPPLCTAGYVGIFSNSMGLVADSLDMLADSIVYALALFAVGGTIARKNNIAKFAGYFQILLAVIGFIEVVRRFIGVEKMPDFQTMIVVSVLALIANVICLYLLQKGKSKEAHMQASMIFTSNDVIINSGVILAGLLVNWLNSGYPDLIIGAIVFVIVARGAYRILQLAK